jgi:hypothetical protein
VAVLEERMTCAVCRREGGPDMAGSGPPWAWLCLVCEGKYPEALVKASCDEFDYMLRLATGEVWTFTSCEIDGGWVHLKFAGLSDGLWRGRFEESERPPFDRGVDVRLDQIVWVADAPFGS